MNRPPDIHVDFETYSEANLLDVGAWKYSEHPSTEVLMMAYSFCEAEKPDPTVPIKLWHPDLDRDKHLLSLDQDTLYDDPPEDLIEAIRAGGQFHAHNVGMEYAVWHNVLRKRRPDLWPEIPVEQLTCTMALCANFSYPLSLEKAGAAIGGDFTKDNEGKRLIRKFSKPRKPSKNNPSTRVMPWDDPVDFAKFGAYCEDDVRTDMSLMRRLPRQKLSDRERRVFELDFRMNRRGVMIDMTTVQHIKSLALSMSQELEKEVKEITGGFTSGQRDAILQWAADNGYSLPNYQADTVQSAAKDPECPDNVRRVLEIRSELGKTSVKKLDKMTACAGHDHRARGMVQYYGAQRTGRFAGRLIQVHNFPRGSVKGIHEIAPHLKHFDVQDCRTLFDKPMEAFSSALRSMVVAGDGYDLYVTDFSNIEGRVLAWMAKQKDLVRQFASGDDVYKHMAATIFSTRYELVDDDQRFVGKQAVLGCGYQMGGDKFHTTCLGYGRDIGLPLAHKTVRTYRQKNKRIRSSWYEVQEAVEMAINHPGKISEAFMCKFRVQTFKDVDGNKKKFMLIKLPSGRTLTYESPRIVHGDVCYMGVDQFTNKWAELRSYGGKFCENIVQAVARDIMADAMLLVETKGYRMLMTVHDELVADRQKGHGSIEEFNRLIKKVPPWAKGCPIDVEGWTGPVYRK